MTLTPPEGPTGGARIHADVGAAVRGALCLGALGAGLAFVTVTLPFDTASAPRREVALPFVAAAFGSSARQLAKAWQRLGNPAYYRWSRLGTSPDVLSIPARLTIGAAALGAGGTLLAHRVWPCDTPSVALAVVSLAAAALGSLLPRLEASLALYRTNAPREPLLRGNPGLRVRVLLGRAVCASARGVAVLATRPFVLLAVLAARIARLLEEPWGHTCSDDGCRRRFDNPPLACRCDGLTPGEPLDTWPRRVAPLFVVCPRCRLVHPTWRPARRAIERGDLRIFHPSCPFACHRSDARGWQVVRILLLVLDARAVAPAVRAILRWVPPDGRPSSLVALLDRAIAASATPGALVIALPERLDFDASSATRQVRVDLVRTDASRVWAGDHDAAIIVAGDAGTDDRAVAQDLLRFSFARLEVPRSAPPGPRRARGSPLVTRSAAARLFGPAADPLTVSFPPPADVRLAAWTGASGCQTDTGSDRIPFLSTDESMAQFLNEATR